MPISQSSKVTPDSLVTGTPPDTGQIPASDGNGGFIWVDNNGGSAQTDLVNFVQDIRRRGFVDNTETSVPYLSGAQKDTVNLDDMGSTWSYYYNGAKRTITGNKTVALTGGAGNAHADGAYYIYINTNDGALKVRNTVFDLEEEVTVACVIWNSSLPSGLRSVITDERHTDKIDSTMHEYLHSTVGTKLETGGVVSGYILNSATDADKQYDISEALIQDEDLHHTINALVGGNGVYTNFYRTEPEVWGWSLGNNFPFRYTTSGRLNYDNATATGIQVSNGFYINTYVLITNIQGEPKHLSISSQTNYETAEEAHGKGFRDLDLIGFPLPEYYVAYKLTWHTDDTFAGTGKCKLERVASYGANAFDSTPTSIGSPFLVNPSVANNFVGFSTTTGQQLDSGYKGADFQLASEKGQASGYVALDASKNINLSTGGLKSTNVTTAIKLGDSNNTSLSTVNKTIVGAINEIESELSYFSAGIFGAQAELTDNGNGSATISSAEVLLYSNTDFTGTLKKYTIPEATLSFTDNVEEYIVVDYTAGVPVYRKETDISLINSSSIIRVFTVWRLGLVIHSLNFDSTGAGLSNKLQDASTLTTLYERSVDGGLVITETTSPNPRTVLVTSANIYTGGVHQTVSAFDSSTDTMTEVVHATNAWTYADKLVYNNLQYDPGTNATSLGSGKYGVVWFYRSIGDAKQVFYVLGTQVYDSETLAGFAQPRTDLPVILRRHCMLIGRAVILSGATSGNIESSFNVIFNGYSPMSHNDMSNIQGGISGQEYHLTSAEHTAVGNLSTMSTQSSSNVSITGGSVSGITDLAVLDGGTGASDAGTARTNLGLGTIATQASSNVSITGGAISGTTITGTASLDLPLSGGTMNGSLLFSGTTNNGIKLNNLTTTQRDALTGANGNLIYNTTTNRVNPYTNGAWRSGFVRLEGDTMDVNSKLVTAASVAGNAGFNIPSGTAPTVLVDGDIYYDSTQKSLVVVEAGLKHDLVGIVYSKTDDTTVTASLTNNEVNLLGTGIGTATIPANFLTVGRTLRYRASGTFIPTNNSATFIFRIKLGTSILATTATIDPTSFASSLGWFVEGDFVVRTTGQSGTCRGNATLKYGTSATAFVEAPMVNTTTVVIDTTVSNVATPSIQYTQTTVNNSLTCTNFTLEMMN